MKYLKKIFEKNNNEFKVKDKSVFPNDQYTTQHADVSDLIGETVYDIKITDGDDEVAFYCKNGSIFIMYHEQDCCESVYLYDIVGDLDDLIGSPMLRASEDSNVDDPKDIEAGYDDSHTWTFYNFGTMKGYVSLRWLGQSNGYYAEGVSFIKISHKEQNED